MLNAEIRINPKLLRWAREELAYSKSDLASLLKVDQIDYENWENTGTGITLDQLIKLSKICKRQIAFFFLPIPTPEKTKKPTDFRNLATRESRLSPKTMLAIRRAVTYQDFLAEINTIGYYQERYLWLQEFQSRYSELPLHSDEVTLWARSKLNYTIDEQLREKTPEDSYARWRISLETNLGLPVFQFSMPASEVQGFCYGDSYPYCIIINSAYHPTSRTFTLIHEFAHILKSQSGLCKPNEAISLRDEKSIELQCNSFAGRLLVPDEQVLPAFNKEEIYERASKLRISSEVYLRRLWTLGRVTDDQFFLLLKQIRESVTPPVFRISSSPINRSLNSRGHLLFNVTLDAVRQRKISYERASDILELKINHLLNA